MIRVLNIISDTNIGGAGRVILNYLKYADRSRFEPMAAIPRGSLLKEPLEQAGAPVFEVDGMADRSYHKDDVKALQALIRQVKPDLVHTHGALSGRIAARRCRVPVVYSRHSAFPVPSKLKYPPGRWVNKWINEHYADHIIAVSPATRDNLLEGGISPKKITVVMNGTAPVPPTSPQARAALRELRFDADTTDAVCALVGAHMFDLDNRAGRKAVVRMIARLGERQFLRLADVREADFCGSGKGNPAPSAGKWRETLRELKEADAPISRRQLAVNGGDVMRELHIPPGKRVGEILSALHAYALKKPSQNSYKNLIRYAKIINTHGNE